MKRAPRVRELRRSHAAVGALIIGMPAAVGAGQAIADTVAPQPEPSGILATQVRSRRLEYGQDVVLSGTAPASDAGQQLQLQFAPAGSSTWSTLSSGAVSSSGQFRLAAPLRRSGLVRVSGPSSGASGASNSAAGASAPTRISVAARLHVPARPINDLAGQSVNLGGKLLPGLAGRTVRLQGRSNGAWTTLSSTRTRPGGRFRLRFTPSAPGQQQLRVRFGGDRANAWSGVHAGRLTVLEQTVASWYNDAGNTACGFHAYYGVANRDLPCGTQVTFVNGGRTVTATVDDRGPFVGGRDWDLNQNTAAALGFAGVGSLWASV